MMVDIFYFELQSNEPHKWVALDRSIVRMVGIGTEL